MDKAALCRRSGNAGDAQLLPLPRDVVAQASGFCGECHNGLKPSVRSRPERQQSQPNQQQRKAQTRPRKPVAPVGAAGLRLAEQPFLQHRQQVRRLHLAEILVKAGQAGLPCGDGLGKSRVAAGAVLGSDAVLYCQNAQHEFGGQQVVILVDGGKRRAAHVSRHSLNRRRLRRSQVRIVFSGTSNRRARSS